MLLAMKFRLCILLCLLGFSALSFAVVETYQFDSEVDRKRYHQFIEELRCPKCQNQNLSGSDSPIAKDLRHELYTMIEDGRADTEIVNFMVERYGEFVLYRPPLSAKTIVLWGMPPLLLLIALIVIARLIRQSKVVADSHQLSSQEQLQIEQLLKAYDKQKHKA